MGGKFVLECSTAMNMIAIQSIMPRCPYGFKKYLEAFPKHLLWGLHYQYTNQKFWAEFTKPTSYCI